MDRSARHPATQQLMRWFDFEHLPPKVKPVPEACADFMHTMLDLLDDGPELSAGLRHLLEAKDCFTRAQVDALSKEGWPGEANTATAVKPIE